MVFIVIKSKQAQLMLLTCSSSIIQAGPQMVSDKVGHTLRRIRTGFPRGGKFRFILDRDTVQCNIVDRRIRLDPRGDIRRPRGRIRILGIGEIPAETGGCRGIRHGVGVDGSGGIFPRRTFHPR